MGEGPAFRVATGEDFEAFYGMPPKHSMRAWVADLGGRPVGIGGVMYLSSDLPPVLFSAMKPELRRFPKAIVSGARQLMAAMSGHYAIARADPAEAHSQKLLTRLGLQHVQGSVFEWTK